LTLYSKCRLVRGEEPCGASVDSSEQKGEVITPVGKSKSREVHGEAEIKKLGSPLGTDVACHRCARKRGETSKPCTSLAPKKKTDWGGIKKKKLGCWRRNGKQTRFWAEGCKTQKAVKGKPKMGAQRTEAALCGHEIKNTALPWFFTINLPKRGSYGGGCSLILPWENGLEVGQL